MIRSLRTLTALGLTLLLTGCAGGWRGGVVPAEWAANAPAAAAAAPAGAPAAAPKGVTHATADGAVFVWKGEGKSVNVAGDFNAWSTSADALKMDTDGTWKLDKKLAPGKYAYKFVIDGGTWKPDPGVPDGVDDGFGGKNSVVVVGGGAAPAAPAAAVASTPKAGGPAVTAAGVVFKYAGPGNTVHLAGEFNSWSTSADPLTKGADGTFTLTKALAPGKYAYKFVIDGGTWKEDPNATESVDDGYGGKNSLVVVGGTAAATPAPAAAAPAAVKALAAGAAPRAPKLTADGVVFTYAGSARTSVTLCGDFNGWATAADKLTQAADGTWTITRKLAPGSYAYKFLVDGSTWKVDDGNPQAQDDGFGGKNSLVIVK